MDKIQEIMALVGEYGSMVKCEQFDECDDIYSDIESKLRALLERKPLSHSRILELQESHVGGICPSYPLDSSDWCNFTRAIEIEHGIGA